MNSLRAFAAVLAVLFCAAAAASADVVEFRMSYEFSGATSPTGSLPWLIVTIDDCGTAGSVNLTLQAKNLIGNEFVSEWYLNLDPNLNPDDLSFSPPTKFGSFDAPAIDLGENKFKADGDGNFDIMFMFDTGGNASNKFGVGEKIQYTITGISTLTASSFDFLSDSGKKTGWPTAAHVQAIGDESKSGWVSVPEPATLSLLAVGAAALLIGKRRRQMRRIS